eukprot:CAMPEP_0202444904 /NCGR_PEP_ID=MMETSP1360-20130828/3821_1 /ASSEMBLY_ACC=CAM_ASM_000848 /TAXON_ID=515479 /ORGANISM="Licmophora paradoxa, Strain CCMP2313" /LENGTH=524 /DNA_ID=CAMNT_0049061003 /DNA_START=226 /DNA_END=1800 /DNA_ORIENTATION=-
MSSFFEKLGVRSSAINSLLCVGLDPHEAELKINTTDSDEERADAAFTFCKTIIDATAPYAVCYKPNAAFFEALGSRWGMVTLERVLLEIPSEIPVLLDVKRGDIGSTAAAYAKACFETLPHVDAVTLSPLMGWDSVAPFVTGEQYQHKAAFLLCKTSNPGSNDLLTLPTNDTKPLFQEIASLSRKWSSEHNVHLGLVVGATDPVALQHVRQAAGDDVWILAPGVGAQGGDLEAALRAGLNSNGTGMLIPVSRGISRAEKPGEKAKELQEQIEEVRQGIEKSIDSATSAHTENDENNDESIAMYQKEFLEFALSEGVLKFGSFVLKSGRTSPYFFNAGLFCSGAALFKLGRSYASAIMASNQLVNDDKTPKFDVIFGPAYKGISLGAVVVAALYNDFGIDSGFAYDRKEAKDHGEGGKLVGADMKGKRVLVIDDVITAGTAIRISQTMLESVGANTVGVVIALDRAEKRALDDPISAVQAVARDLAIPVVSIVNLPQLQTFLRKSPDYDDDVLKSVSDYRLQYGV